MFSFPLFFFFYLFHFTMLLMRPVKPIQLSLVDKKNVTQIEEPSVPSLTKL